MPLEPGQVIDQYRLDQTIHRGRATIVYAATDVGLGRKVAFKILGDRYATDDVIRQRFVNEAQVAASLDGHPHIVTVYKWGEFEGSMYFVTELIDGISLAELLERQPGGRPLQPNEALGLLTQIADALDFAHKRGAIHRDVKPANVMVKMTDTPRTAYLVDFGITKMDDGETGPQGMFLGTPDYASPEQISGAQALDRRSDVYSLACTAFEVLTGRPPFGDAPNDAARIAAHLQSPVPSARAFRPELPPAVDAVFAKALAKNREDRYASCGEFVRELRAVFPEGTHIFRRPPPPGADLPAPSLYTPDMAPRRKWPWVALGVLFAVLLTAVAYFVTSRRDPGISTSVGAPLTTTTTTTSTTTTTTYDDHDHDAANDHDDRSGAVRRDRPGGDGDRLPAGGLRRRGAHTATGKRRSWSRARRPCCTPSGRASTPMRPAPVRCAAWRTTDSWSKSTRPSPYATCGWTPLARRPTSASAGPRAAADSSRR